MKAINKNIYIQVCRTDNDNGGIIIPSSINDRPQNWPTSGYVISAGSKSMFRDGDLVYFGYYVMQSNPNANEMFLQDSDITFYFRDNVFYCVDKYVLCKPLRGDEDSMIKIADFDLVSDTKNLEIFVEGNTVRKYAPIIKKDRVITYNKAMVVLPAEYEGENLLAGDTIIFQSHGWQPVQPEFKRTIFDGMELIIIKKDSIDGKYN